MKRAYFSGQSLSEYAIVLAIVFAGAIGMQTYLKRGIQAGIKATADNLSGETINSSKAKDYDKVNWHIVAKRYDEFAEPGFNIAKEKNGNIYYYHYNLDLEDEVLFGIENKNSGNFTGFYHDGYPSETMGEVSSEGEDISQSMYLSEFLSEKGEVLRDVVVELNGKIVNQDVKIGPEDILKIAYPIQKYNRPENKEDGEEEKDIKFVTGSDDGKKYRKHQAMSETSSIVQKGVVEKGLVKFEYSETNPMVITTKKNINFNVKQRKVSPTSVFEEGKNQGVGDTPKVSWHPAAKAYFNNYSSQGFNIAEDEGKNIYYYHYDKNGENEVLVGIESKVTGDFTGFDSEGYPFETIGSASRLKAEENISLSKFLGKNGISDEINMVITLNDEVVLGDEIIPEDISLKSGDVINLGYSVQGYMKSISEVKVTEEMSLNKFLGENIVLKYGIVEVNGKIVSEDGEIGPDDMIRVAYPIQKYMKSEDGENVIGIEDGKSYGKHAKVIISPKRADYSPASFVPMKTIKGNEGEELMERTEATGSWSFTYEIEESDSLSASQKESATSGDIIGGGLQGKE